ncbi:MAG: hypothetical protein HFH16_09880 [Ruminococcus sp.]|uniref:hypothetical protein n=1 Tax=Schaedlerella arabinosiphila TaxID=2044587 RepID=UPI0012B68E8A|nr:hypothetical protein [Schaedlerella arabinosiphila]MCI8723988.1 hypothetical protein [Ruminococcus sp.]MCI9212523.1 hypothetical protein [Ruminococcus sp.]
MILLVGKTDKEVLYDRERKAAPEDVPTGSADVVKLPVVYRHYIKYGWVKNLT